MELTLNSSGTVHVVGLGESVHIGLPEIAGTGYLWQLLEHRGLTLVDERSDFDGDQQASGSGATRVFVFQVDDVGRHLIRLARFPPWLGEHAADENFTVEVRGESPRTR